MPASGPEQRSASTDAWLDEVAHGYWLALWRLRDGWTRARAKRGVDWLGHHLWWSAWRLRRWPAAHRRVSPGGRWSFALWWSSWRVRVALARLAVGLALFLLSSVLALALFEVAVRLPGFPMPPRLGRFLFSCYESSNPARHINVWAPGAGITIHRPGLSRRCYINTYWWDHEADAYGWRNPETWEKVDVALIGDSMIYGQAVEETSTVASHLRQMTGLRVANLGKTGTAPAQYLSVLRNFALPLRPRVAVVVVYGNDLEDTRVTVDERRMAAFMEQGAGAFTQVRPRKAILAGLDPPPTGHERWTHRCATFRILDWLAAGKPWRRILGWEEAGADQGVSRFLGEMSPPGRPEVAAVAQLTQPSAVFLERWDAQLKFFDRVFAMMVEAARAAEVELVIAYLPQEPHHDRWLPAEESVNANLPAILASIAAANGVRYLDATPTVRDRDLSPIYSRRLPFDGHLSDEGHHRLAQLVAAFLAAGPSPAGPAPAEP